MSITHIVATDNIGLSIINDSSKMSFVINETYKNNKDKILELCINQIIKKFNPSKPYFFCDNNNIIDSSELQIDSKCDNTLTIQINPTQNSIYKLKFVGIMIEPIYYLCTSHEIFNDTYEKIVSTYKNCVDGIFTFNSKEIDLYTPLDKLKFKVGCGKINEIIFETNVVKTTNTYTKYKNLFESYKISDKCDEYTTKLDGWYGIKKVFIQPYSYLYCFKYNLLKKFLDAKLINDKDLDEINLTPHLKITTKKIPCCKKQYAKYNDMKIIKINIEYEKDCIYFYIDNNVYFTLFSKKGVSTELYEYKKIIDEELKIFQIIEIKKKIKEKIPAAVKNTLWTNYFGNITTGKCQCCKTQPITNINFDCGHVISEKNGGTIDLDNLRPICRHCNSSMGIRNMDDFMKEYKFNSTKSKEKELNEPVDSKNEIVVKKKSKKVKDDSEDEIVAKNKTKKIKSYDSDDSYDSKNKLICSLGCGVVLKSTVTKQRHENNYCKIFKQQKINNIESEKMKNEEKYVMALKDISKLKLENTIRLKFKEKFESSDSDSIESSDYDSSESYDKK
jgi:hypothetical protein